MSSTVVTPIGTAISTVADGLSGVKGFTWAPAGDLDSLPAAVVYLPSIERTAPDQPEDHISQVDWRLDYPVHFLFDDTDKTFSQPQAAEIVEAFIKAIDAGVPFSLDGMVEDAKVTSVEEPTPATVNNRQVRLVVTRVQVLAFV